MAVSTSYVARETASNLRRNLVMTVAAIVTMFVSLTALAAVLLMKQAVNSASVQWRGGVQVAIFMDVNATPSETNAVAEQLKAMPGVKSVRYVNQQGALAEFKQMFAGDPTFVSVVTAADLPPSFRIVPTNAANVTALGNQFSKQPGVHAVEYAAQEINSLLTHFHQLRIYAYVIAGAVMMEYSNARSHPAGHRPRGLAAEGCRLVRVLEDCCPLFSDYRLYFRAAGSPPPRSLCWWTRCAVTRKANHELRRCWRRGPVRLTFIRSAVPLWL